MTRLVHWCSGCHYMLHYVGLTYILVMKENPAVVPVSCRPSVAVICLPCVLAQDDVVVVEVKREAKVEVVAEVECPREELGEDDDPCQEGDCQGQEVEGVQATVTQVAEKQLVPNHPDRLG